MVSKMNIINKRIIIIGILILFLTTTLSSSMATATDSSEVTENPKIKWVESEISMEPSILQIEELVDPTKSIETEITVKFRLNLSTLGKWFFFKQRIGRTMLFGSEYFLKIKPLPAVAIVDLSIESPDWCTATLDRSKCEMKLDNTFTETKTKVR